MANTRLSIGDHDVWITVRGKELEHYGMGMQGTTNEISCWIPSEVDLPFSVCWQKTTGGFPSSMTVYLDGHFCRRRYMWGHTVNQPEFISSIEVSPEERRNFRFGSLEVTDDDAYLKSSNSVQNIGEIKIVLESVVVGEIIEPYFVKVPEEKKVHERSKKAMSHKVKYGEKRQLEPHCLFRRLTSQGILGTAIFRYRPLAVLQANGIAPRNPSPPPTHQAQPAPRTRKVSQAKQEHDGEGDSDNIDNQERVLLERLSSFQAELDELRSEKRARREAENSKLKRKVKTEPKIYFAPGEVIDLT